MVHTGCYTTSFQHHPIMIIWLLALSIYHYGKLYDSFLFPDVAAVVSTYFLTAGLQLIDRRGY